MRFFKNILAYFLFVNVRINVKIHLLLHIKKKKKLKLFRIYIIEQLRKKYHVIISEHASIGSLVLPHPHNIVIGRNVRIGENCKIYHDVTIGQNLDMFPEIGNNVIIYTGAKVIGGITIGNNAIIGANSVVTHNIPENAIVAGIPARVIKYRNEKDIFY